MRNEFPHTVAFQEYTEIPDGGGGYKKQWADFLITKAFVNPISGHELYEAMKQEYPVNTRVYFPFSDQASKVNGHMRAVWIDRDKTLRIQTNPIDQGGLGEEIMVGCLIDG